MSTKAFLHRAYLIFDLTVYPACIFVFIRFFYGGFAERFHYFMIAATSYLCVNSVAGIVLCKKKRGADEKPVFSKNWMIGIYIANAIGVFSLFMPVCQFADCLERKMFDYAFFFLIINIAIVLILIGQPKWQRAVVYNALTPKFFRICFSIANPIRALIQMLLLFAMTVPSI